MPRSTGQRPPGDDRRDAASVGWEPGIPGPREPPIGSAARGLTDHPGGFILGRGVPPDAPPPLRPEGFPGHPFNRLLSFSCAAL